MILIDSTYFIGELSVPSIPTIEKKPCWGVELALKTVGGNNLDHFANKYIVDYLTKLFGRELTDHLLKEEGKGNPNEIWKSLLNRLVDEDLKLSPLANYVYYWLMRDGRTNTTMAGEADPNFDNARNVNNQYKLVNAWNDMSDMTSLIHNWFCANIEDYKDYVGCFTGRNVCSLTQTINTFGI